jgi:hypothetical protein
LSSSSSSTTIAFFVATSVYNLCLMCVTGSVSVPYPSYNRVSGTGDGVIPFCCIIIPKGGSSKVEKLFPTNGGNFHGSSLSTQPTAPYQQVEKKVQGAHGKTYMNGKLEQSSTTEHHEYQTESLFFVNISKTLINHTRVEKTKCDILFCQCQISKIMITDIRLN